LICVFSARKKDIFLLGKVLEEEEGGKNPVLVKKVFSRKESAWRRGGRRRWRRLAERKVGAEN
jgi:hypothetical protein